ncbi:MAG: DUF3422 domain-containing protein [Methylibium sp.]|nr:DUF3422 domain-containing protein [Methylibium sp.]
MLPPDHPQRRTLADEVHARPPEPLGTPSRASYIALLVEPHDRARELAHIVALCERHAVEPPDGQATQFSVQIGPVRLKWERHGEFSAITLFAPGPSGRPFSEPVVALLPADWVAALPGVALVAAHAEVIAAGDGSPDAEALSGHFAGNIVVGAEVGEGAGLAFTDFRVHADGFSRVLLCNRSFTTRQAGRMLQRLFEIEAYRMMALLALPVARRLSPRCLEIERSLATLTARIAADAGDDEALLQELTRLAAELESELTASQFRFGACRAYHALVTTRIAELRERRLAGIQTIDEFMARRLNPAVATCETVSRRLHGLSERVAQVSGLLSTRVDIKRERQNQALLASMDRRAKQQLRLQQTVEGLSLAAIVYYVVGLLGYAAKAGKAGGLAIEPDLLIGAAIPIVAAAVFLMLRRTRRRLHNAESESASPVCVGRDCPRPEHHGAAQQSGFEDGRRPQALSAASAQTLTARTTW